MSYSAQVELFEAIKEEIAEILPIHYDELAMNKEHVPLDFDYERYLQMEENGGLFVVTLRKESTLIGYYIGFVGPEPHYASTYCCMTDIFYVLPDYRRDGAGKLLFKTVEFELKLLGIDRWFVSIKDHSKAGAEAMMKAMEFKQIETTFSKWIGGE